MHFCYHVKKSRKFYGAEGLFCKKKEQAFWRKTIRSKLQPWISFAEVLYVPFSALTKRNIARNPPPAVLPSRLCLALHMHRKIYAQKSFMHLTQYGSKIFACEAPASEPGLVYESISFILQNEPAQHVRHYSVSK